MPFHIVHAPLQAKPKDMLVVPIATFDGNLLATDYVEYDIANALGNLLRPGLFFKNIQVRTSPCP